MPLTVESWAVILDSRPEVRTFVVVISMRQTATKTNNNRMHPKKHRSRYYFEGSFTFTTGEKEKLKSIDLTYDSTLIKVDLIIRKNQSKTSLQRAEKEKW